MGDLVTMPTWQPIASVLKPQSAWEPVLLAVSRTVGLSDVQSDWHRTVGLTVGLSDSQQTVADRERVAVDLLSDHCRNDCRTVGHCRTLSEYYRTLSDKPVGLLDWGSIRLVCQPVALS